MLSQRFFPLEKEKDKERANKDHKFLPVSFDLQAVLRIPHCKNPDTEANSMHSAIESQKKETSVYSMQDWISICERARRRKADTAQQKKIVKEPYKIKEFKYHGFYDLKDLACYS
ncbi:unnamed protein product, partial [Brenthis ino]